MNDNIQSDKTKNMSAPVMIASTLGSIILGPFLAFRVYFMFGDKNPIYGSDLEILCQIFIILVFFLLFCWAIVRIWLSVRRHMKKAFVTQVFCFGLSFFAFLIWINSETPTTIRASMFKSAAVYGFAFRVRGCDYNGGCKNKIMVLRNRAPNWQSFSVLPQGYSMRFHKGRFYFHEWSCCESPEAVTVLDMSGRVIKYCELDSYSSETDPNSKNTTNLLGELVSNWAWNRIYHCKQIKYEIHDRTVYAAPKQQNMTNGTAYRE